MTTRLTDQLFTSLKSVKIFWDDSLLNALYCFQKKSPQYILNLGSRIYIGDDAQPRQRFAAIAQEFYKTELKTVNFNDPAIAAKEINNWVSNTTQGKIPILVDEG